MSENETLDIEAEEPKPDEPDAPVSDEPVSDEPVSDESASDESASENETSFAPPEASAPGSAVPLPSVDPFAPPPSVDPFAPPFASLELPVKEKRKFPWRLAGAAVTMLAVGTACAFAVMAPQRTDLPGLKTASDGRYVFAPLTLPTLAPGQAAPSSTANAGSQHISDIRKLLLSPPQGATLDRSLPGTSGWVSRAATVQLMNNPQADLQLTTDGWRHTAGVAWKTPDGADTKIWLVQFTDSSAAEDAYSSLSAFYSLDQPAGSTDENITVNATTAASYIRVAKGATATWYGEVQVDDTFLLIEYTAPASIGLAPFAQELSLQAELLQ